MSNEKEYRAFKSFLRNGTSTLGGQTDIELWRRWIPQFSHAEPAIKHAAIAVGSLLLDNEIWSPNVTLGTGLNVPSGSADLFAIHHYQKAIRLTLLSIRRGNADIKLAGMTCVLFFTVEALQGNEHEALQIFERGRNGSLRPSTTTPTDVVVSGITESFSRLAVQWSMFGGSVIDAAEYSAPFEESISSTFQAQRELTRYVKTCSHTLLWTPITYLTLLA